MGIRLGNGDLRRCRSDVVRVMAPLKAIANHTATHLCVAFANALVGCWLLMGWPL